MSNHSQVVWIVECLNLSEHDTFVDLYESELDAMSDATNVAVEYMKELGCDDPLNSKVWNDYYREIVAAKAAGDFRVAMKTYDEWNSNHQNYEDVYNIFVYSRAIKPDSKINIQMFITSRSSFFDSPPDCKVPNREIPKKEIPCNVCGTTLYVGESPCWKCGGEDTAG